MTSLSIFCPFRRSSTGICRIHVGVTQVLVGVGGVVRNDMRAYSQRGTCAPVPHVVTVSLSFWSLPHVFVDRDGSVPTRRRGVRKA